MGDKDVLSSLQKRRLANACQEALTKRQNWYIARITQAPPAKLEELHEAMLAADGRFDQLMAVQGLCVGDLVRITMDGLYRGTMSKIKEIEPSGRLRLDVDGQSVLPSAHEVELAAESNYNERKRT